MRLATVAMQVSRAPVLELVDRLSPFIDKVDSILLRAEDILEKKVTSLEACRNPASHGWRYLS